MCATCGCGEGHEHEHGHGHGPRLMQLERDVLAHNAAHAARTRARLASEGVTLINVLSAPGAGKTSLLERTVSERKPAAIGVIEGDQATERDAERIRRAGARAVQINTGTGCHLDAAMVERALEQLAPERGSLVLVENVGNLVCPALFDLGEAVKVVVTSVTEGDDKPLKYPHMFAAADLVVLNKLDLLPHVRFDRDAFERDARRVNAGVEILALSVETGENFATWHGFLDAELARTRRGAA